MLACSDNYKHNNLIYSQIVLIDITTNDPTPCKHLEASKTDKPQCSFLIKTVKNKFVFYFGGGPYLVVLEARVEEGYNS